MNNEMSAKYRREIAELTKLRENISGRARDAARYEIARLLRILNNRFPRHKFHMDSGMVSIAVWCDKKIFGDDLLSFYGDEPLTPAEQRSPAFRFLRDTIRTMINLAQDAENDFDTCVDTVDPGKFGE